MKKFLAIAFVLSGLGFVPAASYADEPNRNRAAEASDVAAAFGLGTGDVRVLSESEAQQVRGTGGCCLSLPSCLSLPRCSTVNVSAKVNVNIPCLVKTSVKIGVRL